MKNKARIESILNASCLDLSIAGITTFELSELNVSSNLELVIPTNLRLGHMVEKIVAEIIKSSNKYDLIYENIQIVDDKKTVGEIDFIIQQCSTKRLIHLELAYKFYLFDPTISEQPINNWIGPNRNDSLIDKVEKLRSKQFPLLYHERTKLSLTSIQINEVSQALCLLASLYIPFEYKEKISSVYQKGIKGYYLNLENFIAQHKPNKIYYLPAKKDWGIDPANNSNWYDFNFIEKDLMANINEKQAPLCWQNDNGTTSEFFVIWW
jgi:hypothetical protein